MTILDAALERAFRLQRGEKGRAFLMFFYLMGVVSTFIITRNVRDTLLLSRADLSILPYMYVGVAASVAPASYVYSRLAEVSRREDLISVSLLVFAGVLALFFAAIERGLGGEAIYPALYLAVEIIGAISIIQFWTFAQDIYDAREAKRLFGFIGAGGVLSNISCGFAIHWAAPRIGAERLLLVAAAALVGCVALVRIIARGARAELERVRPKKSIGVAKDTRTIRGNRHLELIAGIVTITFITVSIVDYQFKIAAKSAYSEAELSAFFGKFFAYTGIVASLVQFFVTGRLLERRGLVVSLSLLPAGLFLGAAAMLLPGVGLFAAGVLGKSAENIFRYTVNDASMQLLYVPVPADLRARAKAFIDGILKPVSIGLAGLVLAALGQVLAPARLAWGLAWLDLALLGAWAWMLYAIRREYLAALMKTLKKRRLDFSTAYRPLDEQKTVDLLRQGLESQAEAEVLASIDLAGALDADLRAELTALLGTGSKAVRLAALDRLSRGKLMDSAPVRALLEDADAEVRAAASQAIAAGGRVHALEHALARLEDPAPRIRASAIAALYDHGTPEMVSRAHAALGALALSQSPDERSEAARALGAIAADRPRALLFELLGDPDAPVRVQAIKAATARYADDLLPAMLPSLTQRKTEVAVIKALVELSAAHPIEARLLAALIDGRTPVTVRRRIPKVLAIMGTTTALGALMGLLDEPDTELVLAVARAAAKIRARTPDAVIDESRLEGALHRELDEAYRLLSLQEDLALEPGELLHEAIATRYQARLEVVFRLLGVRHPAKTLQLVYRNLQAETKAVRANALEVADNLLSKEESRLLLPLLEEKSTTERVRIGRTLFSIEKRTPDDALRTLLTHPHPWVVTCALHLIGERRLRGLSDRVSALLSASDPLVRETASWALARID